MISNGYDDIICSIVEFMIGARIRYDHCNCQFKTDKILNNYVKYFHKIIEE